MKPKDILIICAILACIIGVLFLIPANPKSKEMLGKPSPVKWDKVSDDMTAKLEISWQGIAAFSEARDGSWIQDYLENNFNIKFKPLYMDWNGFGKRLPLMLVGGDIPDVM
ncbi:MAG: hypothetical protein WCP55_20650, partial [Lentisphaerota bacterium]